MDVTVPLRIPHPSPRITSALRTAIKTLAVVFLSVSIGGCASGGGLEKMVDKTLQVVGIKDKFPQDVPGEKSIKIGLYSGENLNAGNDARPMALVVRIYRLRSVERFEQAPFDAFLDETREKSALGDDLLGVNEIVLLPGRQHLIQERFSADGQALGIVALFRAPAPNRWRFTFDARHKTIKDGITVGLHACAMTTSSAALMTQLPDDPASLVSARCLRSSR